MNVILKSINDNQKLLVVVDNGSVQITFNKVGENSFENFTEDEINSFGENQVFENEIYSRIDNATVAATDSTLKSFLITLKGFIEAKVDLQQA